MPLIENFDKVSEPSVFTYVLVRLNNLETQSTEMIRMAGQVSSAVVSLTESVRDLKTGIKEMHESFVSLKVSSTSHEERILQLETERTKIENHIESENETTKQLVFTEKKDKKERRNRILTIIGTGLVSLIVGLMLSFIKR